MYYALLMAQSELFRKELGEDCYSPIDIFSLSKNFDGLTIVYYPLGDNLSGMCIKGEEENCVIAINSKMTLGRQRFSLAHEFYHMKFDDNLISVCAKKLDSDKEVEKNADMFASYLLMPESALFQMAKKYAERHTDNQLSLDDVIRIEQYFGVSHQAATYRLMHTQFLNQDSGNDFLNQSVRYKAESLGYISELYRPSPEAKQYITYGNYINQAEQVFYHGLVSVGKYEQLLLDAFRADLVYGDEDEDGDLID